jgi:4a-hydroxytetrahydrobiopterin dehydratase
MCYNERLKKLGDSWWINKKKELCKDYKFKNFIDSANFFTKVAQIAELSSHHPDILIGWNKFEVRLFTHDVNNLSDKDFIFAEKIDKVYRRYLKGKNLELLPD